MKFIHANFAEAQNHSLISHFPLEVLHSPTFPFKFLPGHRGEQRARPPELPLGPAAPGRVDAPVPGEEGGARRPGLQPRLPLRRREAAGGA